MVAAPQIASDLRDLPFLIAELRGLITDNLPTQVRGLEARIVILEAEVSKLRSPVISGGEGPDEPESFMLSPDDVAHVRERLQRGSHIPGPEEHT